MSPACDAGEKDPKKAKVVEDPETLQRMLIQAHLDQMMAGVVSGSPSSAAESGEGLQSSCWFQDVERIWH